MLTYEEMACIKGSVLALNHNGGFVHAHLLGLKFLL